MSNRSNVDQRFLGSQQSLRVDSSRSSVSEITFNSSVFHTANAVRPDTTDAWTRCSSQGSRVSGEGLNASFRTANESLTSKKSKRFSLPDMVQPRESDMSLKGQLRGSYKNMAQDLLLRLSSLGIYARESQMRRLEQAYKRVLYAGLELPDEIPTTKETRGSQMSGSQKSILRSNNARSSSSAAASSAAVTVLSDASSSTTDSRGRSVRFSGTNMIKMRAGVHKEVVWISGVSGSGKTALVSTFREHCMSSSSNSSNNKRDQASFFASGAFDSEKTLKPYSGISQALIQFCNSLLLAPDPIRQQLRERLQKRLTPHQLGVLAHDLIPNLAPVLSLDELLERHARVVTGQEALYTLQIALQIFAREVSSIQPFVLMLDDLQWADVNSLDLIEQLLGDNENPNMLFIGLYRDAEYGDDMDSNSRLMEIVRKCPTTKAGMEDATEATSRTATEGNSSDGNANPALSDDDDDDSTNDDGIENEDKLPTYNCKTTNVVLNEETDLGVEEINMLLLDFLKGSPDHAKEQVLGLAELVHQKTQGSPFYVNHFISNLVMQESFQYSVTSLSWTWNLEDIRRNMEATSNVVDVVKSRLQFLNEDRKLLLQRLACLEARFSYDMCCIVGGPMASTDQIDNCLREYVHLGLIYEVAPERMAGSKGDDGQWTWFCYSNTNGTGLRASRASRDSSIVGALTWRKDMDESLNDNEATFGGVSFNWAHDKIKESVLAQVSKEELNGLKLEMAQLMLDKLTVEQMEEERFCVANMLNAGLTWLLSMEPASLNATRRLEFARFNLRAGKEALQASAFVSASSFLEVGINLLPQDSWEEEYDLTLDLYSSATEAECYQGKFEKMQQNIDQVLERKSIPLLDKRRAYNSRLSSLAAQNKHVEAREECLSVLALLGCSFPKVAPTLRVITGLIKTKMSAKKLCAKDVNEYPVLSDPQITWVMELLDKLMTFAFLTEWPKVPLIAIKAIKYTQKYGVGTQSAPMFALAAFLICVPLGDYKTGKELADLSLRVLQRAESQQTKARTYMFAYAFVYHWTEPVQTCRSKLLEGYKAGLAVGDLESASWDLSHVLHMAFFSGASLIALHADVVAYGSQVRGFAQETAADVIRSLQYGVETLSGSSSAKSPREIVIDKNYRLSSIPDLKMEMLTSVFLGNYTSVVEIMKENRTIMDGFPGVFGEGSFCCYIGVSYLLLARRENRKGGSRRYIQEGKKWIKRVKGMVEKGCPNSTHHESLMDACLDAATGREAAAIKHFEVAALLAGRKGFMHDHALAQQLLGEYHIELGSRRDDAIYHIREAIKLFQIWGADAVAENLREKHLSLLAPVQAVMLSMGESVGGLTGGTVRS